MRLLFILAFGFLIAGCGDDDCDQLIDTGCFSFDIRQCQTDAFAQFVSENDSVEKRENDLKDWLEDQGVFIDEIKLVTNFHEAVCEACHVCPQGDRYFVQMSFQTSLNDLDLLNLEAADCCEHFGE